tara:strand:- start:341 stop:469 length:129 start_codon:yes stop_codon:yes gene_type:complete
MLIEGKGRARWRGGIGNNTTPNKYIIIFLIVLIFYLNKEIKV